jgi:Zn finger protein HypA/HybF involved in hydrogenase expression
MIKAITPEEFETKFYNLVGAEYTLLSEYKNNKTKIYVMHNKCGTIYQVSPNKFLLGQRCPHCSISRHKDFQEEHDELLKKNPKVELIGSYISTTKKADFKCLTCGAIFQAKPNDIYNGHGCPKCYNKDRMNTYTFRSMLFNKTEGKFLILDKYSGLTKKSKFLCTDCLKEFSTQPSNIIKYNICPFCNKNKYIDHMLRLLSSYNIKYETKKIVETAEYRCIIPYDIVIGNIIIDFRDIFHYKKIYGKDLLTSYQEEDILKYQFCKMNNLFYLPITRCEIQNIEDITLRLIYYIDKTKKYNYYNFTKFRRSLHLQKMYNKTNK